MVSNQCPWLGMSIIIIPAMTIFYGCQNVFWITMKYFTIDEKLSQFSAMMVPVVKGIVESRNWII